MIAPSEPSCQRNRCNTQGRAPWFVAAALMLAVLVGAPAPEPALLAQEAEQAKTAADSLDAKLDQKGTVILRDASLVEWLFAIQKEWGVDIVVGNELQRDVVNGGFTDATLREVLTSILYSRGYGYRRVGKSLLIVRLEDMSIKPDQVTALFPLEFLDPQEVEASVQAQLSQMGKVQAIQSSKSLFVIDTPEIIDRIKKFLDELEAIAKQTRDRELQRELERQQALNPNPDNASTTDSADSPVGGGLIEVEERVKIFAAKYVDPESLAEALQSVLINARVNAVSNDNKIVVIGTAKDLEAAEQLLEKLDVPARQVRITAYMYDVNVKLLERLGFNWQNAVQGRFNGSGDPQSLLQLNNQAFPPVSGGTSGGSGATAPGGTAPATGGTTGGAAGAAGALATTPTATGALLTLSHLSRHFNLTQTIHALEQSDGARLLARPNIVAYDRVEATFQSVQEIPVQQLTQTQQGGNIGTTQFREAGITLRVTPTIMPDDSIVLVVAPEFSVLNGFNNGQPIIDRRKAQTKLALNNGAAAVIGGLVRRNEIETQRGVPGIKNWKFFGVFFRDHETTVSESELVVFIRAEIVGPSYAGDPRDEIAHSTVDQTLEQVPYANPGPVVPTCRDPYCPLHYPRPPVYADTAFDYKTSHEPFQQTAPHAVIYPDRDPARLPPATDSPPPIPLEGDVSDGPALESEPTQPPSALPPPAASEDFRSPPPVITDELTRRQIEGRLRISRLPHPRQELRPQGQQAPVVVRPSRQASLPDKQDRNGPLRTAKLTRLPGVAPLPATEPLPTNARSPQTPPRKNWLENIFIR